jgi:hypothetical protein
VAHHCEHEPFARLFPTGIMVVRQDQGLYNVRESQRELELSVDRDLAELREAVEHQDIYRRGERPSSVQYSFAAARPPRGGIFKPVLPLQLAYACPSVARVMKSSACAPLLAPESPCR